jgi:hypothetical protein
MWRWNSRTVLYICRTISAQLGPVIFIFLKIHIVHAFFNRKCDQIYFLALFCRFRIIFSCQKLLEVPIKSENFFSLKIDVLIH